jgi:mannose-6-phosphate isomerase-like protein (cupin superfamily)
MNPDGTMFIGDVSEGDLWIFPAGFPHSLQGLGPDGTEFLLVFNQGNFSEDGTMLLSEWVAHTPPEVLAKNTGLAACANSIGTRPRPSGSFTSPARARMTVFFPVDNAHTMDFNANDVGYVPSNAPHYIENTGDTDLVFLETLPSAEFADVSLNQWLRRVPSEMLKAHLNIDKEMAMKIPAEKLVVI